MNGNGKTGFIEWTLGRLWLAFVAAFGALLLAKMAALPWFSTKGFLPRGVCYNWQAGVLWLHIFSNGAIAGGLVLISGQLLYIYMKRREVQWVKLDPTIHLYPNLTWYVMFLFLCGISQGLSVVAVWVPIYWSSGFIRLLTAVATIGSALETQALIYRVTGLVSAGKIMDELKRLSDRVDEMARESARRRPPTGMQ